MKTPNNPTKDNPDLLNDLLWRLKDIREELMSTGVAGRCYNCDEWSTPTVNLAQAIKRIEEAKSEQATEPAVEPDELNLDDLLEAHHIAVQVVEEYYDNGNDHPQGMGGRWEIAAKIAKDFQALHKDTEWDGEFMDELESYALDQLNSLSNSKGKKL